MKIYIIEYDEKTDKRRQVAVFTDNKEAMKYFYRTVENISKEKEAKVFLVDNEEYKEFFAVDSVYTQSVFFRIGELGEVIDLS
jgi:hypothetical protein